MKEELISLKTLCQKNIELKIEKYNEIDEISIKKNKNLIEN